MAVTKIHGIKATIGQAIEYICNPAKTDENIYISSFACAPETAALDFKYTLDHATDYSSINGKNNENKAFHLIQAFEPGEVSYNTAHAIGKELADKLLKGKYSYVLTTHIDRDHVHNHIIFCAADNINHNHLENVAKNIMSGTPAKTVRASKYKFEKTSTNLLNSLLPMKNFLH